MKSDTQKLLSVFLFLFICSTPCSAGLINCNEQGPKGKRVCEDREKVIEHEEVFTKKIITYELRKIEPTAEAPSRAPSPDEHTIEARTDQPTGSQPRPSKASSGTNGSRNNSSNTPSPRHHTSNGTNTGNFLTCVTSHDYDNISKNIKNGRSGGTGNKYYDSLIRLGQINHTSQGIWVGNRVALVCPENNSIANTRPGNESRGNRNGTVARVNGAEEQVRSENTPPAATDFQEITASPTESDSTRLVPVESIKTWTETWYETVIEQFCWWVPDEAIVDPVTMEPIEDTLAGTQDSNGQDPVPEPATMLLFGSIMAFFPTLKKRFLG